MLQTSQDAEPDLVPCISIFVRTLISPNSKVRSAAMNRFLTRIVERAAPTLNGRASVSGTASRGKFESLEDLVEDHFSKQSNPRHPCRHTMTTALQMLNKKSANILEMGSSAWGTNSTLLFDSYVNSFGGSFSSVDIRLEPMITLHSLCTQRTVFHCSDSICFLKKSSASHAAVDLIYLDSWDVDWKDPLPSALHGFHEFLVVRPFLKRGALVLVDDTPRDSAVMLEVQPANISDFDRFSKAYGFAPGKGALIKNFLVKNSVGKEIKHDYQLLWQF